ncbi:hypothetical protein LK996_10420 [Lysobacter sp. A6]|uniref:Uncharacterized protein n=1 Tax=Noviluteimonas lactosilytica TaxID=2888523 RepID=A0ABS8JIV4_9GAMM|nr:hypothetical protein [Lysobacter lactosilyticus]MCC8363487.1 hypothetical protein [Lysobacter lactosilyticus]
MKQSFDIAMPSPFECAGGWGASFSVNANAPRLDPALRSLDHRLAHAALGGHMIRFAIACAVALCAPLALAQEAAPNDEAAPSPFDIPYPDVATARAQVTGLSNARVVERADGFLTVLTALDSEVLELWDFVPATDPAYPAVVRRRLRKEAGGITLQRSVLCEAAKEACDAWKQRLSAEEAELRQKLMEEIDEEARQDRRRNRRYREAARSQYGG